MEVIIYLFILLISLMLCGVW